MSLEGPKEPPPRVLVDLGDLLQEVQVNQWDLEDLLQGSQGTPQDLDQENQGDLFVGQKGASIGENRSTTKMSW